MYFDGDLQFPARRTSFLNGPQLFDNQNHIFTFRMPSAQPPAENGAGPPRSELEELQIRANQVTDEVKRNYLFFLSLPIECGRMEK